MVQKNILDKSIQNLVIKYKEKIERYSIDDFLKSDVDPFRFGFNVILWGLRETVQREIQHKLEMALENLIGDFHEDYLGNVIHEPTKTNWRIVPKGEIKGIDIANEKNNWYLQIKSKFNSMNSSSANNLATQLQELSEKGSNGIFGCGWVIAGSKRKCIGEKKISEVAKVFKGKDLYSFVAGNADEMDEVIEAFPPAVENELDEIARARITGLIESAIERVQKDLEKLAEDQEMSVVEFLYERAVR